MHDTISGAVIEDTANQHGFFHQLTETSKKYVEHCRQRPGAIALDIGAGKGVATLPALAEGARVIALDIESSHLEEIKKKVPQQDADRLHTLVGEFPGALSEIDEPINSVLMAFVIGFVSGGEITRGFSRLYELMVPEAQIFIVHYTPFTTLTKNFIPEYNRRRKEGHPWPGYCENIAQWCDKAELQHNLPNTLNLMDREVLTRELKRVGFEMISSRYYGGNAVSDQYRMDGREWVEAVARK